MTQSVASPPQESAALAERLAAIMARTPRVVGFIAKLLCKTGIRPEPALHMCP